MTATKTNEVRPGETPGVRAKLSFVWISPYKVRQVLDLIRGKTVGEALSVLQRCERDAADAVGKVLGSAVANAEANAGMDGEELYVSACFADEGMTFKRFRYRARGRAGKIRKRTSHITVIVNRLPEERLARVRSRQDTDLAARRRRVAGSRRRRGGEAAEETSEVAAAATAAVEAATTEPAPTEEPATESAQVETAEVETTPAEDETTTETPSGATEPAEEAPAEPEEENK